MAADDVIYSVRVNGQHQFNSLTGFGAVDTVVVEEGLLAGPNTLEIIVYNTNVYTGLWCEIIATHTPVGATESLSATLVEDMLKVSWPVRDPAFSLTYNSTLDGALPWSPVTAQPDLIGSEFSLKFPTELEKGFYRLVKPEITKPPVTRITVDPTGPASSQPVYLASNGENSSAQIPQLGTSLGGALIHRFDAGDSFDPRKGNLSYNWKIFYPPNINGSAEYTGPGLSGNLTSALQIAANTLPTFGGNAWRARLTVTSDAGGLPLSRVAEFNFQYTSTPSSPPVVTVVVDLASSESSQEVGTGCTSVDGCNLTNALPAIDTHVFDASASIDPRGGTLSYYWEFRYPSNFNGGIPYTHSGIVINGPVATISPNSFPDIGSLNYRVRLTVISTLPDGSIQSKEFRFRFNYADSELPF
ncbi:hypothetical protein [Luteolibacter soli]|uniref:Uncharacterized protein n=1 Tax=Luteolibacter soli TaxID=3135280 RepID=A0ABU9B4U0_9BACT